MAVVGVGLWGRNLVRVFAELEVLGAVVDRDERAINRAMNMLEAGALRRGIYKRTWRDVLLDDEIEAVILAVPVAQHKMMAMAALEHGKHVWIEKPMVTKVSDADDIIKKALARQRKVMVNHLMLHHPCVEKMIEMLQNQTLGRILHIESERKAFGRIFPDADALEDLMPHDMAVIRNVTTLSKVQGCGEFIKVHGFGGVCPLLSSTRTKKSQLDWATAYLHCEGRATVKLDISRLSPEKCQRITLQGEKGMLVFDDRKAWTEKLIYYPHQIGVQTNGDLNLIVASGEKIALKEAEPLARAARHFVEVVANKVKVLASAQDARDDLVWLTRIRKQIWNSEHAEKSTK